jgi:CHAT domain-containing protein
METAYDDSEGTRCSACGLDLGTHRVWTIVFSDDETSLVERVLSGTINRVVCPHCGFAGGWIWPTAFLYMVPRENRAVCVTQSQAAAQQLAFLRTAVDSEPVRRRGLDTEQLLARTKFVNDYRDIAAAAKVPIEQVEMEHAAMLRYLGRKELHGKPRIEAILEAAIKTGVLSLEGDEITPDFLEAVEQYRAGLTGEEDWRVPRLLDQLVEHLRPLLVSAAKVLPRCDGMTMLADVLGPLRSRRREELVRSFFEDYLAGARNEVLQQRLARLSQLQADGLLRPAIATPVDLGPDLMGALDALIMDRRPDGTIMTEHALRALPEVKEFLRSIAHLPLPRGLHKAVQNHGGPPPAWQGSAVEVLKEGFEALHVTGFFPSGVFERIAHSPLARALVLAELGKLMTDQGDLGKAMQNLTESLDLVKGVIQARGDPPDYWSGRLYAVCLERLGTLQSRYGRFEEAIGVMHAARSIYEHIGAQDGVLYSLRAEADIWLSLGRREHAEALFAEVVRVSAGTSTVEEVHGLLNLANVYRYIRPYAEAQLTLTEEKREGGTQPGIASDAVEEPRTSLEMKGGIGVSVVIDGEQDVAFRDVVDSEQIRILFRALAIATLNGDGEWERIVMGRLVVVYAEQGCEALANLIFNRILEHSKLEDAGLDPQVYAMNRLRAKVASLEEAGDIENARAAREEELQVLEFILRKEEELPTLAREEMRGEKSCLLESLDRAEEARRGYHETIERLERTRGWMRDPENKKGLQSRRWRPYVRAARNALRIYAADRSRGDLLVEAWNDIQAGRSRTLLDAIAAARDDELNATGVASVRPAGFRELSERLSADVAILDYFLMPSSPGCPGSWAMFVTEPDAAEPWLAWQESDLERVWDAQRKLADVADEYEQTVVKLGVWAVSPALGRKYVEALEVLADILLPGECLERLRALRRRRLVIVPDAYLHEVPFAALRPMQTGGRAYLGLPDGQSGFQIIYAPSSSIFGQWAQRAPERHAGTRRRAALFVDPLGDLSKPALDATFSSIEARMRASHVDVTRRDEREATRDAWLNMARDNDLVVYFGHSEGGPERFERAALMLNDGHGALGPVTAEDIYRAATRPLFSKGSLLIFASCSGGFASAGAWDSDRELRGISVAHLYAGCHTVIAASRPLLDSPTLVLLDPLVTELLRGEGAASSLTEVQRKLSESETPYAHPHFWGYIGVMGAPDWRLAE